MLLSKEEIPAGYVIKSYSAEGIVINDEIIQHSLILSTTHLLKWSPNSLADLQCEDWDPVIALSPEILIIGVGQHYHYPEQRLLTPLYQHRIGFEVMDTAAACRTITLLFAEKRAAVAALIIDNVSSRT